jgi:hydroxyacylglutathione hydrolase
MNPVPMDNNQPPQIVPLPDEGLGNQSYLVALGDGRALVIDPSRDPSPYLQVAEDRGLRLAFAVETHLHADFISGSRELAAQGASIVGPRAAELQAAYRGLEDGDEVDLGALTLRALATPGHTPEHLAYLLLERNTPVALFSGGALIPGGAARTDLIDPGQTEKLARELHRSARRQLAGLPDHLVVYPTHGGGSFCSAGAGGHQTTTLGRERHMNPLLTIPDEDAFVRAFLAGLGSYPSYFRRLRAVNRRGARVYGPALPDLRLLSVEEVRDRLAAGVTLIDTRPFPEFASGHVPGALAIALRPAFASWLGWIVPADRPLMFVAGPDQDRRDLIAQCLKIGYEDLRGELAGGMAAWRGEGLPESRVDLRPVDAEPGGRMLLDVRQANEWVLGHLPGARPLELGRLPDSADSIPSEPLTIYCQHGDRAMTAASLLEAQGRQRLAVLDGGFEAWSRAGRPVVVG